jgi:hypothetical protein
VERGRGPRRTAPSGPDNPGDLLKRLEWEDRPHLEVASLVRTNARDSPDLGEEARTVRVHKIPPVKPLDSAVSPRDRGVAFRVRDRTEPELASQVMKLGELGLTAHVMASEVNRAKFLVGERGISA